MTKNDKNNNDFKSKKELIQESKNRTLKQEIDNDVEKFDDAIKRPEKLKEKNQLDNIDQEQKVSDLVKRIMLITGTCDLKIKDKDGNFISTGEKGQDPLPIATYLAHGGRINIIGASPELMNWISTGDKDNNKGISAKETQAEAIQENKLVYYRPAATHDIKAKPLLRDDNQKTYDYIEKKGFKIGAKSYLKDRILGKKSNHQGADLVINVNDKGYDPEGNKVTGPDGDHGHLYINYKKEKGEIQGTMLIGVEGASPNSSKHSKLGTPDPLSPTGSGKWSEFKKKQAKSSEDYKYKKSLIPDSFGSARIEMDSKKEAALVKLWEEIKKDRTEQYNNIAKAYPAKNAEEFKANYNKGEFHSISTPAPAAPQKNTKKQESTTRGIDKKILESIRQGVSDAVKPAMKVVAKELTHNAESVMKAAKKGFSTTVKPAIKATAKELTHNAESVINAAKKEFSTTVKPAIKATAKELTHNAESVINQVKQSIKGKMDHPMTKNTKRLNDSIDAAKKTVVSASNAISKNKALKITKKIQSSFSKKKNNDKNLSK